MLRAGRLVTVVAVVVTLLGTTVGLRVMAHRRAAAADLQAEEVSAAALSSAPWVPRTFYGHRLEPQHGVLHGAGQSDNESFDAYAAAMPADAKPVLFMSYVDLRADLPPYFARLRGQLQALPVFALPQIGLSMNADVAANHYEAAVAAGDDDAHLTQLCDGLRSLGRPVYLRPGYEFDGPWNGYAPSSYVAAFQHIATRLRACGLPNVALVWDANMFTAARLPGSNGDADRAAVLRAQWSRYYPGDAYVDWWGLNLFSADDLTSKATGTFLADAAAHHMPVIIAESTSQHVPVAGGVAAIQAWFAPFFGLIRSQPGIRAFCYIDWDWAKYPQWADWGDDRVETDRDVLRFYTEQIVSPHIDSATAAAQTLRLVRAR